MQSHKVCCRHNLNLTPILDILYLPTHFPKCFRTAAKYHYEKTFVLHGTWIEFGVIQDIFLAWDWIENTSYALSVKDDLVLKCLQQTDFCPNPQPEYSNDKNYCWSYDYIVHEYETYITHNPSRNI